MGRLAKNEIYFDRYVPLKETIAEIDRIKKKDVDEMSQHLFGGPDGMSLTILGPVDAERIARIWKN
jgi:hypothetical protein